VAPGAKQREFDARVVDLDLLAIRRLFNQPRSIVPA